MDDDSALGLILLGGLLALYWPTLALLGQRPEGQTIDKTGSIRLAVLGVSLALAVVNIPAAMIVMLLYFGADPLGIGG